MSINPSNAISERITGKVPFPNVAGVGRKDPERVDALLALELTIAGINEVRQEERYGEPQSVVTGELLGWKFRRLWYYWAAEGPGIPLEYASSLHVAHGKSVRVDGHCGCPSPEEWCKGQPVTHYHVDNQEGLVALASTIRIAFGPKLNDHPGPEAEEAAKRLAGLPLGALNAERAAIVQDAIDAALTKR
jgi:hypothetical protein